jgi:hypothetical protein
MSDTDYQSRMQMDDAPRYNSRRGIIKHGGKIMRYICVACDPDNPCVISCYTLKRPSTCPMRVPNSDCKWMTATDLTHYLTQLNQETQS